MTWHICVEIRNTTFQIRTKLLEQNTRNNANKLLNSELQDHKFAQLKGVLHIAEVGGACTTIFGLGRGNRTAALPCARLC